MKRLGYCVCVGALILCPLAVGSAWAHGGHFGGNHFQGGHVAAGHVQHDGFHEHHHHRELFVGAPVLFFDDFFAPQPVVIQSPPEVFVEQGAGGIPATPGYWYYCANPPGYYPNVRDCPVGWQPLPVSTP